MVELGSETSGQLLRYLANLETKIWNYFGKVDEAIEKAAAEAAARRGLFVSKGDDQYVVMTAYLSSLNLERPKESYLIKGDSDDEQMESSDDENDVEDKKEDQVDKKQSEVKDLTPKCGQTDSVSSSSSTKEQLPVVTKPASTEISTSSVGASIEKSLSAFSQTMIGLSTQMLTTASSLVHDLAKIQKLKVSV